MKGGSDEYTVEYVFKANVDGLEKGAEKAKSIVKDVAEVGKDFQVNWGEGTGSIEEYTKWLENAQNEYEEYLKQQENVVTSSENLNTTTNSLSNSVGEVSTQVEKTTQDFSGYNNALYGATASMNDLDKGAQALLATMSALEVKFAKDSLDSFASYEDAIYGMATTVGQVGGTIEQAFEGIATATANGLVSETDAAKAIQNLTTYGYSVEQATSLIQELTNVSMAHRDSTRSVSEQVEILAEAIKNENNKTSERLGLTNGITGAFQQYASALGTTTSELDKAQRQQAIFDAVMEQGSQDVAIADEYQKTYSASTQRLSNSINELKSAFGQVLAPVATFIANAANWIVQNKALVVGLLTFAGTIIGSGGVVWAVTKLIPKITALISLFSGLSVASKGIVVGLATVATAMAVVNVTSNSLSKALSSVNNESRQSSGSADDASVSFDNLGGSIGGVGAAAQDTAEELAKLRRDYLEDLKQIEQRHQETINKLTKQIQDANVDYRRAVEERTAEFEVSQAKEERKHQEKVDDLVRQIDFLQRYNNDYNREKLQKLQYALARENALYQKQTEAAANELEIQNENDRKAFEEKRQQYQKELDDELAFMEKHREDLIQVRDVILLDEIDSLNRRYEEQQASYAKQTAAAGGAGANIAQALVDEFNRVVKESQDAFNHLGDQSGQNFSTGFFTTVGNFLDKFFMDTEHNATQNSATRGYTRRGAYKNGYAYGGYTGQGGVDEIAGVVHKGEYVLPQSMVNQNTGEPKALGNTYVINVSGVFATSQAERRRVADQIVTAINQNQKSRLEASWQ